MPMTNIMASETTKTTAESKVAKIEIPTAVQKPSAGLSDQKTKTRTTYHANKPHIPSCVKNVTPNPDRSGRISFIGFPLFRGLTSTLQHSRSSLLRFCDGVYLPHAGPDLSHDPPHT